MALNPSRRLEVDSVLKCPDCGGVPFKVFRRQNQQADGTLLNSYESVLWPATPDVAPPKHGERLECPHCRCELKRVAP